jgi:hypothetical protein
MSDCAPVRTIAETRFNTLVTALRRKAIGSGLSLLFALMSLTPGVAYAQDYDPPTEAPNLPASLRLLVPRGWVATSFAEVDMNKDGNLDRAVLLTPSSGRNDRLGNITGTPLKDRRRNLMLLVGQPSGRAPLPTYLPWSFHRSRFMTQAVPADFSDYLERSGKVFAVRDTLRFSWDFGQPESGEGTGTQVFRVEGQCLRLIGTDYKWFQGEDEHETSVNFLTNTQIDTRVFVEEGLDGKPRRRKEGPRTSTIEDTGPICANPTPLVAAALAPHQPPPAPQQPPQAPTPAPALPKPAATPPPRYSSSPPVVRASPPPLDCSKPPSRQKRIDNSEVGSGFDPNTPFCGLDVESSDPFESSGCQLPTITVPLGFPFIATRDNDSVTDSIVAVNGCGLWIQTRTDDACFFESDPGCTEPPSVDEPRLLLAQPDGSFLYQEDWRSGDCYSLKIEPLSDDRFRVTAVP